VYSDDRGDVDGAAPVAVVHDEPAAVPNVEGEDGIGDAVAADGDALGEPLLQAERYQLLQRGGEPRRGAPLRDERVHGAHRRDRLLGDGARAPVLLPDPARQAELDSAVEQAGDDEQQHGRQRHHREPPLQREPDGVAAHERGDAHHEVGQLLAQHVLHHQAVVGDAGDHLRRRAAGLEVEVLHVLPEHRPKVTQPHPRRLPLRRPRPAVPLCSNVKKKIHGGVREACRPAGALACSVLSPRNAMTKHAAARKRVFLAFWYRTPVDASVTFACRSLDIRIKLEMESAVMLMYLIHLGAELLEAIRAAACIVEDVAHDS